MAADLREMQENRGVSENRIDKLRFVQQKHTAIPPLFQCVNMQKQAKRYDTRLSACLSIVHVGYAELQWI